MRKFTGDTLVLATHSAGKINEMRGILAPYAKNIRTAKDLNLPIPNETGTTFIENAKIKALAVARATKQIALSDDSGLCVNALNGAPGVYTADWAGHPRNFHQAMHRLNNELGRSADRSAYFTAVMVLAWPDGHTEVAEGRVNGQVVWPMRGTGGHGYDPVFRPEGTAKTFAEMTLAEKQAVSHRTMALKQLLDKYFS